MAKKSKDSGEESYYGILNELFERNGALEKLSRVRYTYFEIYDCWYKRGIAWEYIDPSYKAYFIKRFLKGHHVDSVKEEELRAALENLAFAVGMPRDNQSKPTGCYARCLRLIGKLNKLGEKLGYKSIEKVMTFINYYTLWAESSKDFDGRPRIDPDTKVVIAELRDRVHLLSYRKELKEVIEKGEQVSARELYKRAKLKVDGICPVPCPDDKISIGKK